MADEKDKPAEPTPDAGAAGLDPTAGEPTPDAPTITIEPDAAGELHEVEAVTVPGEVVAIASTPEAPPEVAPEVVAAALEVPPELAPPDADAGDAHGDEPRELCDAQCGTAVDVRCKRAKGHEDPSDPDFIANEFDEPMHDSGEVRWPVNVEAAEAAAKERMRQRLAEAQELERLSKAGDE